MRNRWVIPDIHGCSKTLKCLIENNINLSKEDSVYFLGDYIDRGYDSKGVIDYIMSLQDSGYDIHCLITYHFVAVALLQMLLMMISLFLHAC